MPHSNLCTLQQSLHSFWRWITQTLVWDMNLAEDFQLIRLCNRQPEGNKISQIKLMNVRRVLLVHHSFLLGTTGHPLSSEVQSSWLAKVDPTSRVGTISPSLDASCARAAACGRPCVCISLGISQTWWGRQEIHMEAMERDFFFSFLKQKTMSWVRIETKYKTSQQEDCVLKVCISLRICK